MQTSTSRVARKRQRAREDGFCITCCKRKPVPGLVICAPCKGTNRERKQRKRERERATAKFQLVLEAHERDGDLLREHHLFTDAAQRYRQALDLEIHIADRLRITWKSVEVYFLSDDPAAATPLQEWLMKYYLASPQGSAEAVHSLTRVAVQLWLDSKTEQALPVLQQAIKLANTSGLVEQAMNVNLQYVRYLHVLERVEEAKQLLERLPVPTASYAPFLQYAYFRENGLAAAFQRRLPEMHRSFRRALEAAETHEDVFRLTVVWVSYASAATILSDIELAKSCFESALFIARRHQIGWRIPYLCTAYADVLVRMGRYTDAREYLIEALSHEAQAPALTVYLTWIGITVALHFNDRDLLARCDHPASIELAFQAGQPGGIGAIAAAFAHLYIARNEKRRAQMLLHRALPYVQIYSDCWEFCFAVARHGIYTDLPHARSLLKKCESLAGRDMVEACLHLFDAYVAKRHKQEDESQKHALAAVPLFERLHWKGYADLARGILPVEQREVHLAVPIMRPFSDLRALFTEREAEVAELILKGFTNRAIADALSIAENTVEKHVTSIMNRLGIRSRYQLIGMVSSTEGN